MQNTVWTSCIFWTTFSGFSLFFGVIKKPGTKRKTLTIIYRCTFFYVIWPQIIYIYIHLFIWDRISRQGLFDSGNFRVRGPFRPDSISNFQIRPFLLLYHRRPYYIQFRCKYRLACPWPNHRLFHVTIRPRARVLRYRLYFPFSTFYAQNLISYIIQYSIIASV